MVRTLLIALVCASPAVAFPLFHSRKPAPPRTVPLESVAAQVVRTLDTFNAEAASRDLPALSRVVFDFNIQTARSADLSFDILIFNAGGHRETDTTNEVTFTYTVPASAANPGIGPHARPAPHDFSAALLATLEAAAAQVKQTQSIGAARFSDLTVTIAYGVVLGASAGGEGTISLATLDGSISRRRSDVQTLTLTFGQ